MPQTLPYGSWPSPITAADVAVASPRIDGARFVGDAVWWSEGIPSEGGRTAIFRRASHGRSDVEPILPGPWSARSRVQEYGGGAWTVIDPDDVVFVEHSDQRVWRLSPGGDPQALTPKGLGMRFADLTAADGRLYAVRETHADGSAPVRDIVIVPLDGTAADNAAALTVVVGGTDFIAYPTSSGGRFAWVSWNHPEMPWDAATLHVGRLAPDGTITDAILVAGGPGVSALQPAWTGPDELTYIADPHGRWNLFRVHLQGRSAAAVAPVAIHDSDTGGPLWNLGLRWFAPLEDGRILAIRTHGRDELVVIEPTGIRTLGIPLSSSLLLRDVRGTRALLTGGGARTPGGLWTLDVDDPSTLAAVRGGAGLDAAWLPASHPVTFEGPSGDVHAFDYPPTNPDVNGPDGERPPYLVLVHGGPTSHVAGEASAAIAYFTSRGIGVLDVNYGGSTGYGRRYRERLHGQWGVVDVEDVAAAARGLAAAGVADPRRLAIKGGSAGGWTVLCALADTDVFAAGISRYGVADLRALAEDTHDFEARYLDRLVGPLPEALEVYIERSPLTHSERLRAPVLILQGADDPVVPPAQSRAIRDALAHNGVAHAYVEYEGESHGFRRAETIVHAFESELSFLGQVLGFDTPGVPVLPLD
ncbi:MAG TPA: prolyl oligopeptidase family serine peptidase [Microbacterium sp.]|uniref:alpha/beta hydrolase family protein n=1 Tax=Microbacterium sp. TaxID=51671 RepID=UPI002CAB55AC|nr:prolyl oligopeptidase family serine peptidase [Microbacterium sp.]HWI29931.1 prolyl oligopeptidase family serine peptidase [Microbacterium sp.]